MPTSFLEDIYIDSVKSKKGSKGFIPSSNQQIAAHYLSCCYHIVLSSLPLKFMIMFLPFLQLRILSCRLASLAKREISTLNEQKDMPMIIFQVNCRPCPFILLGPLQGFAFCLTERFFTTPLVMRTPSNT